MIPCIYDNIVEKQVNFKFLAESRFIQRDCPLRHYPTVAVGHASDF